MGIAPLRTAIAFCAAALLFAAAGCAGGLWSAASAPAYPALDPAKGRVFVYRGSSLGSTLQVPAPLLNGEALGKLAQPGVLFRDVPPGSYAVTTIHSSRIVNFAVAAGEKKYVKLVGGFFDAHMHPELVDAAQGEAEVSGLAPAGQGKK